MASPMAYLWFTTLAQRADKQIRPCAVKVSQADPVNRLITQERRKTRRRPDKSTQHLLNESIKPPNCTRCWSLPYKSHLQIGWVFANSDNICSPRHLSCQDDPPPHFSLQLPKIDRMTESFTSSFRTPAKAIQ